MILAVEMSSKNTPHHVATLKILGIWSSRYLILNVLKKKRSKVPLENFVKPQIETLSSNAMCFASSIRNSLNRPNFCLEVYDLLYSQNLLGTTFFLIYFGQLGTAQCSNAIWPTQLTYLRLGTFVFWSFRNYEWIVNKAIAVVRRTDVSDTGSRYSQSY